MSQPEIETNWQDYFGFTALHYACQANSTETFENKTQVQLLLQKPSNLNAKVSRIYPSIIKL
jgi:hypothetical protein